MDFIEANPVTAIVSVAISKAQCAAGKDIGDRLGDLLNPVVFRCRADIKNLVVNSLSWSFERAGNGIGDVQNMDQRPPRAAIAGHFYFFRGPGEAGQIIDHEIEPHSG